VEIIIKRGWSTAFLVASGALFAMQKRSVPFQNDGDSHACRRLLAKSSLRWPSRWRSDAERPRRIFYRDRARLSAAPVGFGAI
jgi:hypothetical protein